jgi:hypothetical protein
MRGRFHFCVLSVPLEVLHFPFMLLCRGKGGKRAQVATFARLGVELAGIEPKFAGGKFADHGVVSCWATPNDVIEIVGIEAIRRGGISVNAES